MQSVCAYTRAGARAGPRQVGREEMGMPGSAGTKLFSTCPRSKQTDAARYRQRVTEIARRSKAET
jgi:hypothetical protein